MRKLLLIIIIAMTSCDNSNSKFSENLLADHIINADSKKALDSLNNATQPDLKSADNKTLIDNIRHALISEVDPALHDSYKRKFKTDIIYGMAENMAPLPGISPTWINASGETQIGFKADFEQIVDRLEKRNVISAKTASQTKKLIAEKEIISKIDLLDCIYKTISKN